MNTNHKKQILVITNMYPSKKNPSFGIFIKNQVNAIRNQGFYVDVIGIKDFRMGKFYKIKKYLIWAMKILFSLLRGKKYSIVHCHYVFPSGFFGLMFKRLFGAKLVITAHGGDIDKMARKNSFLFNQTKRILKHADSIIAVGENLKQDMISDFQIPENKIFVNNMGVNREIFKPIDKDKAKNKLKLSKQHKHIVFVGNLIEAKGLRELISAFKKLKIDYPETELHLIGSNKEPAFLSMLKEKIKKENIKDIHFYPPMTQNKIATWMSAADVFVLPSYLEGFGLSALEAMSCHTPVVGSNVGGLTYLLSDDAGILVKPKDIESLKEGIEKVLNSEDLRNTLIMNGEQKAKKYSLEKQIDFLVDIYNKLSTR